MHISHSKQFKSIEIINEKTSTSTVAFLSCPRKATAPKKMPKPAFSRVLSSDRHQLDLVDFFNESHVIYQ